MKFIIGETEMHALLSLADGVAATMSDETEEAVVVRRINEPGVEALRSRLMALNNDEQFALMALAILGRYDLDGNYESSLREAHETPADTVVDRLMEKAESLAVLWRRGLGEVPDEGGAR